MSLILNGRPEPRIVLSKDGVTVDDFTLQGFEGGESAPPFIRFVPDVLRHPLDTGKTKWKLRGFDIHLELLWKEVLGEDLQKLNRLLDRRAYDTCVVYPWRNDKPFYSEGFSLDDEDIELAYLYLLSQRDFTLKLVSSGQVDYVPLEDADFISWGNIALQFTDLNTLPYTSYMRTVTIQKSGGAGTITAATKGYFKDGAAESVGGQKSTSTSTTFQTDVTTTVKFTASGGTFVKWQIGGVDSGTQPTLNVAIMGNVTITAVFA